MNKVETIDQYIVGFPAATQQQLQRLRSAIQKAAPEASESISYGIPCFSFRGKYLVYFAGYKKHIGVYPIHLADPAILKDFAPYQKGKGTAQFPLDKPIPLTLISRFVKARLKERKVELDAKKVKKADDGFLSQLVAPARRALENEGLTTEKKLASKTEKEILSLHGIGKSSLPVLRKILKEKKLKFK